MAKTQYRLAVDAVLAQGASVVVAGNAAHYLSTVLRLSAGDAVSLFNRNDGEWSARIRDIRKKEIMLVVEECSRAPSAPLGLTVCFAPIKGGRLETIIEKATELGASVLQPVITARTIVDKVNLERADSIAREAAEQCERIDWPEIRPPVKLLNLLSAWPNDVPLVYGDESGKADSILQLVTPGLPRGPSSLNQERWIPAQGRDDKPVQWAVLTGPEGGFTPDEFTALGRTKSAIGVGLGPRILRADTAIITLCVATLQLWGDWDQAPRFTTGDK